MNEASLEGMLASSIAEDVGGFCWGDGEAEYEGVFFFFCLSEQAWGLSSGRAVGGLEDCGRRTEYVQPITELFARIWAKNRRYRLCVSPDVSDHASIFSIAVAPFTANTTP